MTKRTLRGAGPWEFQPDSSLADGDTFRLDLRNLKYNGQRGYFREHTPIDDVQITNKHDTATLRVEFNNRYGGQVQPNSERPFSDAGVTFVEITNITSGTTVAPEDVVVELSDAGYNADKAARERRARRAGQSRLERVVRDILPGGDAL